MIEIIKVVTSMYGHPITEFKCDGKLGREFGDYSHPMQQQILLKNLQERRKRVNVSVL